MKKIISAVFAILALNSFSQVHFQEDFDNGIPGTWAKFIGTNGLGTSQNWKTVAPGLLSDSAVRVVYEDAGGITEDWLVSPQVALGALNNRLRFYLAQQFSANYNSTFDIRVSTTSQTNHASFTTIKTINENDFSSGSWYLQLVDLSAYNGQNIYLAFVVTQDDGDTWTMDSVVVETPTCLVPANLTAINITNNSATIKWNGAGLSYQIAYYPNIAASTPTFVMANDSNLNLIGLTSNSLVTYFVREICSPGDTSYWSSAYDFTTLCTPNNTLPYSQNFDQDTFAILPCGWEYESNNGNNNRFGLATTANAKSGNFVLYINYDSVAMDDWAFSPLFNLSAGNTYDIRFSYRTGAGLTFEDFDLTYGNAQNSAAQTSLIDNFFFINTFGSWEDTVYQITPSSSGNYSIGIHGVSASDQNFIMFDDFSISLSPTTGIIETNNDSFNIYPNPTNGLFTIANIKDRSSTLTITDVNGKVVSTIKSPLLNQQIDLSGYTKGVYFVTVSTNATTRTKKLIIQ